GLAAGRRLVGRRWLGEQTAVTGLAAGAEYRYLAVEAFHRTVDVRQAELHAGVVDQITGRKIVRAIDDDVIAGESGFDVVRAQALAVGLHGHRRVDRLDCGAGRIGLGLTDAGVAVQHLPVQVAAIDTVVIDNAERADTGRGQIQ